MFFLYFDYEFMELLVTIIECHSIHSSILKYILCYFNCLDGDGSKSSAIDNAQSSILKSLFGNAGYQTTVLTKLKPMQKKVNP